MSRVDQKQPRCFGARKICRKCTGEHPCRGVISIKLLYNFIEIALWHGISLVNLLHIFRIPFHKSTSGELLLGDAIFGLDIYAGAYLLFFIFYEKFSEWLG